MRELVIELPNEDEVIDPLSLNLYTYCYNNPITYADPSGNMAITAAAVAGALLTAIEVILAIVMTIVAISALIKLFRTYEDDIREALVGLHEDIDALFDAATDALYSFEKLLDDSFGLLYDVINYFAKAGDGISEHEKDARNSTKGKHQKGQRRKKTDQGGEKGDARRKPRKDPKKR